MRATLVVILFGALCVYPGLGEAAKTTAKKKPVAKSAKCTAPAKPGAKQSDKPQAAPKPDTAAPSLPTAPAKPTSGSAGAAASLAPLPSEALISDACTCLIVDGTGYKLDKCMSPKVVRSDGTVIWGTFAKLTDEQYDIIQDSGMVAYAATVEEAKTNARAGLRPLVVKALSSRGTRVQSDLVVSDEDAVKILSEDARGAFLAKFRVIFVRNENPPPPEPPCDGSKQTDQPDQCDQPKQTDQPDQCDQPEQTDRPNQTDEPDQPEQ